MGERLGTPGHAASPTTARAFAASRGSRGSPRARLWLAASRKPSPRCSGGTPALRVQGGNGGGFGRYAAHSGGSFASKKWHSEWGSTSGLGCIDVDRGGFREVAKAERTKRVLDGDSKERRNPRLASAGRTDAGVSAVGQLVTFNCWEALSAAALDEAIRAAAPDGALRLVSAVTVPRSFHATFSTQWRRCQRFLHFCVLVLVYLCAALFSAGEW